MFSVSSSSRALISCPVLSIALIISSLLHILIDSNRYLFVESKNYIDIGPSAEECFMERLHENDPLRGSFQVIEGGNLDIDAVIYQPGSSDEERGKMIWSLDRSSQGKFEVAAAKSGLYHICFGNMMSTLSTKSIAFAIHTGHGDLVDDITEEEIVTQKDIKPLESKIRRLSDKISELKEQEQYLLQSLEQHRGVAKSNQQRVHLSTVFEALVLVIVNAWQLYYLRRFFEVKRRI